VRPAAALAACLIMAGCAAAGRPTVEAAPLDGYLDTVALRAVAAGVTPSPIDAAAEQAGIDAVQPGTDRWWLATAEAELRPPEAAQHFDCILDARLTARPRPALTRLMNRLLLDSARVANALAERHPRPRPLAEQPALQPCTRMDETARNSPSWPAGGAVAGAAYGEMFATLAPDRAAALRQRGLELGLSRAVCRVNWRADVEDGQEIGRALFAAAAATPDFIEDLEAARAEIVAARAEGLTDPGCAAERRALAPAGA
jgi:acid phosphatase (class A)